jgi:murein DD-endopeptidase MepM/ murein hydrolase activator NlpD
MAGGASTSVERLPAAAMRAVAAAAALAFAAAAPGLADELYKYRGADGEWIYSDRPPVGDEAVEVRALSGAGAHPEVTVSHRLVDRNLELRARNRYYAPVELVMGIDALANAVPPGPDQPLRFVLPAQSDIDLFALAPSGAGAAPEISYRYTWIPGDPTSEHRPDRPYRAPFAIAAGFTVSQAYPAAETHTTADSRYAVDIAMPVGTGVFAARGGIVFEVASTNFRGGLEPADAAAANLIRILHEDGTYAVYAHLNWNTIRVQPGDEVSRGEYIADSGNTGFTSGPHLHFAVLRNRGLGVESLPVVFEGAQGREVPPQKGMNLVAY